jgi:hypothetical protein
MKLPNPQEAIVPREKIEGYLLSPVHSVGRHKAVFFSGLGYQATEWEVLADDLRAFVSSEAQQIDETEFGTKYEVRGEITGPGGHSAAIVTAWIVLRGEDFARFVSAYPED